MPLRILLALVVAGLTPGSAAAQARRVPVLVELFTSEGCSSCPSADQFLSRLQREQPLPGVELIALGEHVDYWDHLGWRDPYSSAEWTTRQQLYARHFRNEGPYTPQMIVDGRAEFVGSDARRAGAAFARAVEAPKAVVRLSLAPGSLGVRVENLPPLSRGDTAEVLLAITEDNLYSNVARGENAGRRLNHVAVVRKLAVIGKAQPQETRAFSAQPALSLEKRWKQQDLRAVVFVQERASRRILGAAAVPLAAP